MDTMIHPEEGRRIAEARMSFSGNLLTDRQFYDVIAITGILERRISETGMFKDCLNDFTNALARTELFDPMKADTIVRDLFKLRFGMTLNAMRKGFMETEDALFDRRKNPAEAELQKAYQAAVETGQLVEQGTKMTFHRALSHEAALLAHDLGITHNGAKKLMAESFKEIEGRELRDWGKELDEKYYRPQIAAEKKQRSASKPQSRKQQPSYS